MRRERDGQLTFGGIGVKEMAERWGTPLYVFDEATLRASARRFQHAFRAAYPASEVVYAAKAYLSPMLVSILREEGLGLDVASGGEIYAGLAGGMPGSAMTFHGNNKSEDELRLALESGIGLIVIDNDWEIDLLARLTAARAEPQAVLLRLNPAIDVHTHDKMRTGSIDSKFGFPIATGDAERAVARVKGLPGLRLTGYHVHVGSQVFDASVVGRTIEAMLAFSAMTSARYDVVPEVISPGGGFGVTEEGAGPDASPEEWAAAAAAAMTSGCSRHGLPLPRMIVEPGRAIVGPAGVALYRVGARKDIAGVRTYVSVDGGMADNIRPTLYGATYGAALANREGQGNDETITIAGKYCESGDVLIEQVTLPRLEANDLVALPMAGAYCLAMASNYNMATRPAVVLVGEGRVRLIRRRETFEDLLRCDVLPASGGEV